MKFAKFVFWIAGTWGMLVLAPLYFLFDTISDSTTPITHPEFYYGFAAVSIVWQIAFFVIGTDPARFRLMMIPAVLEKFGYVLTLAVLYVQGRITKAQSIPAIPDGLLGMLFVIAFLRVGAVKGK